MIDPYIGTKLKRDIYNDSGMMLVPRGTVLTAENLALIRRHQILLDNRNVDTDEDALVKQTETLIARAAEAIQELFKTIRTKERIPLMEIEGQIIPSVNHVSGNPNLFSILSGLQAKDDYTYRHNIGVAVISTMIGKWLHLDDAELSELTNAAILHDIGKIRIEDEILNKPGKFTDEEYARMKQHAVFGYEIIRQTKDASPRIALAALQHHEKIDGQGVPRKLTGDQIHLYAKITAVANIYDNLLFDLSQGRRMQPQAAETRGRARCRPSRWEWPVARTVTRAQLPARDRPWPSWDGFRRRDPRSPNDRRRRHRWDEDRPRPARADSHCRSSHLRADRRRHTAQSSVEPAPRRRRPRGNHRREGTV